MNKVNRVNDDLKTFIKLSIETTTKLLRIKSFNIADKLLINSFNKMHDNYILYLIQNKYWIFGVLLSYSNNIFQVLELSGKFTWPVQTTNTRTITL